MSPEVSGGLDRRSATWLGVSGILILALSGRTGVAALSPIAGEIELDLPLNGVWLGLLGTIPPLAYALAGLYTPRLARRFGLEGVAIAVAVVTALAHLARGLAPVYLGLFLATIALMLGVGSLNVILPGLVKLYAPQAIGRVTAMYSTAMAISTALPAGVGLWLADGFGWRVSLGSWAVLSAVATIPWLILLPLTRRQARQKRASLDALPAVPSLGALTRSPTVRAITLIFAASGLSAYSVFALLPPVLIDQAGATPAEAALALTLFSIMGLPMSLTIPLLAVRPQWPSRLVIVAAVSSVSGYVGLVFVPALAPLVWTVLAALGTLTFSMSLALIGARTRTPHMATNVSGFVNTVGYLFAGIGPIVTGVLFQLTGRWEPSLLLLAALTALVLPAAWVLAREQIVEDELDQVHSSATDQ